VRAPKVALLFLTKGAMPHDAMWAAWLEGAAGLVPADCAAAAGCEDGSALARLRDECGVSGGGGKGTAALDPLYRQGLFSVYVHVPKGGALDSPSPGSPFTPRTLIAGRVSTEWGGFTLASATKALMRAALADPANQRFALLSEACVPLYSPQVRRKIGKKKEGKREKKRKEESEGLAFFLRLFALTLTPSQKMNKKTPTQTVYAQLMYNPASRINACPDGAKPDWPLDHYRYTWRMEGATGGALTADKWRKSHQWVGLTRRHARAVADDTDIAAAFEKHCTNAMDPDRGVWRSCFSDEHYFATLLALKGWGEGIGPTDCEGDMTHTVWCRGGGCTGDAKLHPKHYNGSEATEAGLLAIRRGGAAPGADCRDGDAAAAAGGLLVPPAAVGRWAGGGGGSGSGRCGADGPALMHGRCSLFARKFNADVVAEVGAAVSALTARDGRERC
jgi:hypothetical protein